LRKRTAQICRATAQRPGAPASRGLAKSAVKARALLQFAARVTERSKWLGASKEISGHKARQVGLVQRWRAACGTLQAA